MASAPWERRPGPSPTFSRTRASPAGAGDSPYASESTFAGNPLFIDLDLLAKDGLLTEEELASARVPAGDKIDYGALKKSREPLHTYNCKYSFLSFIHRK